MPTDSPLDHCLLRLPPSTHSHYKLATTSATDTKHHDQRALTFHIPKIGDDASPPPNLSPPIPTTRDHPPFILPIPKHLIDLYQLGNANTQTTLEKASNYIHDLITSNDITPTHIDKTTKYVINMIDIYRTHAHTIWPMTEQTPSTEPKKLRPSITKADTRQIHHGAVNRGSVRHLSWRTRIGTLEDYYRMYAKGHRFDFLFFVQATIDKRAGSPLMEFWYCTIPYGTVALRCVCM
jgi:hypothetical protein